MGRTKESRGTSGKKDPCEPNPALRRLANITALPAREDPRSSGSKRAKADLVDPYDASTLPETDDYYGGFDGNDAMGIIGMLIGMLLWTYAAFPISKIVSNVGDNIGSSKSGIIHLIFLDLPVSIIKVAGYVLAMVGLFAAIGATLSFLQH